GRRPRHRRARTGPPARLARAGLPGHHRRQRPVPRRNRGRRRDAGPMTAPPARAAPAAVPSPAVRARDVLASEWTKLRSARSNYLTLLIAAVVTIGATAIV